MQHHSATSFLQKFDFLKEGDYWEKSENRRKCPNELSRPCLQYNMKIHSSQRRSLCATPFMIVFPCTYSCYLCPVSCEAGQQDCIEKEKYNLDCVDNSQQKTV